jgi:hypothetical protein
MVPGAISYVLPRASWESVIFGGANCEVTGGVDGVADNCGRHPLRNQFLGPNAAFVSAEVRCIGGGGSSTQPRASVAAAGGRRWSDGGLGAQQVNWMKKTLVTFLFALACVAHASAQGFVSGPRRDPPLNQSGPAGPSPRLPPPMANCNGWGRYTWADGCAGAPTLNNYSVYKPSFFNGTTGKGDYLNTGGYNNYVAGTSGRMSGQTWATTGGCAKVPAGKSPDHCHPPWAVAAVDYPVGPNCPTADCGFGHPGSDTDPTNFNGAGYRNVNNVQNPGNCKIQRGWWYQYWLIYCNPTSPTTQELDIGPLDFSWRGNCVDVSTNTPGQETIPPAVPPVPGNSTHPCIGHGLGFAIGPNVQGPCVIHDSYFVFDQTTSGRAGTLSIHSMGGGCTSMTLRNNVFIPRDDGVSPAQMPAMWNAQNTITTNTTYLISMNGRANPIVEYNAFINCPARCLSFGAQSLNAKYNYFEGVNMYGPTGTQSHGDGMMWTFYNGPSGPSRAICNCSGVNTISEKFDTWLQPSRGSGGNTAFMAAVVNSPYGCCKGYVDSYTPPPYRYDVKFAHLPNNGTGSGPSDGELIVPGTFVPPNTRWFDLSQAHLRWPVVQSCKDANGNVGCSEAQAYSCATSTPCTITFDVPVKPNNTCCSFAFAADVQDYDIENNIYVGNNVSATGNSTGFEYCHGYPCGTASQAWWNGYAIFHNVTYKNNYIDNCGIAGDYTVGTNATTKYTTGPPDFNCVTPPAGQILGGGPPWGAAGAYQITGVEGGNVQMSNGAYFSIFEAQNSIRRPIPKGPPTRLLPAPTRPQGPGPQP